MLSEHEPRYTTFSLELARMIARECNQARYEAQLKNKQAEFTKEIGLFLGGKLTVKVEFDFTNAPRPQHPPKY